MGRFATSSGSFKPAFGIHNVVCCQIVDLGVQEKVWNNKPAGTSPKLQIAFEFIDIDADKDGELYHPVWGVEETNSTKSKANWRKTLEGWRGRAFTPEEIKSFDNKLVLGKPCTLVIGPNENGNPKITAVSAARDPKAKGLRPLQSFFFEDDFDGVLPDWMPDWLAEKVKESQEWDAYENGPEGVSEDPPTGADPSDVSDDDIPF